MVKAASQQIVQIGHSPDPDDAFMWFPLADFPNGTGPNEQTFRPVVDTGAYRFVHVLEDIQTLNDRSERGDLEITALSIHQYPHVADRYAITSCGCSMGQGYGPMVVAKRGRQLKLKDLPKINIAVPGQRTTAFLVLCLALDQAIGPYEVVRFDEIIPAVARGDYDAGLIIHEGQLTYSAADLECVVDLGQWWEKKHGLPLPLGANAIRRDLGDAAMRAICTILLSSINYALEHRDEAIAYALNYARDMTDELADRFIGMYVNQWTLDWGDLGRQAVQHLLTEAASAGLTPDVDEIDFVYPAKGEARSAKGEERGECTL